jgi:transposase-like protein
LLARRQSGAGTTSCLARASHRASRLRVASRARHGIWTKCLLRCEPHLLWRAIDQHRSELDILLQKRRDTAAAKQFLKRVLASCHDVARKIVTDQLRSYPAAKAAIAELANFEHVFVKVSARVNNHVENTHQPMRERERRMCGFRDPERTQSFLSSFRPISAALCPQAAFTTRFALPRTTRRTVRMAPLYTAGPESICFLGRGASPVFVAP